MTLIDSSTLQLVRLPRTRTPPSLSAPTSPRACRSSPRCACTLSWVCWGGRAGVSEAMHRIAASMMDGSRCGRGEFAAGDSQRSRRRGYGAARPRQEMPNFRGSFAENLASCSRRARVCPRERRSSSAVHAGLPPTAAGPPHGTKTRVCGCSSSMHRFGLVVALEPTCSLSQSSPRSAHSPPGQGRDRGGFPPAGPPPAVGAGLAKLSCSLPSMGGASWNTSGKLSVWRTSAFSACRHACRQPARVSESARSVVASSVCTVLWKHGAIMLPHSSDSCSTAQ